MSPFILIVGLLLTAALALLIGYLAASLYPNHVSVYCPPDPCSSTTSTSSSSTPASFTSSAPHTITSSTSTAPVTGQKRTYKQSCERLYDCYTEYGLLCAHGWNEDKRCLCEGSHYWSAQQNDCLRKGEANDTCDVDYQCHREIGFVCDRSPGAVTKRCICAADLYWAKDSNCGQTMMDRIVGCLDEPQATTCLVLDMNHAYHMLTIRSLTERELSFDWFLIDNRVLRDLPQLSCTFNNDIKYCFGLDADHSLKLAQFSRKGFHSIENLGGANRGNAFGLTNTGNVMVFVRDAQGALYSRTIADDEVLPPRDIVPFVSGDPTCYVQDLTNTRHVYCFARNAAYGLSEYAELSANVWRVTPLGRSTDRLRDESAPTCSYVGQVHRYCFAILESGQIYRISFGANGWGAWQLIGENRQFLHSPVFLISPPLNQSCHVIAIDTDHLLHVSTNVNCAVSDSFSAWLPVESSRKFQQFDKPFRLRNGHVGVLGIDVDHHSYYIYFDTETNRFTVPQQALTVKPAQFRA